MKDQIKRLRTGPGFFLMALILWSLNLHAQQSNYVKEPGYWTIGINGGAAYQQGDIPVDWEGWGVGLTLGKNVFYQQGAPFSFDLRGRALYTQTYGLDKTRSFAVPNNPALNGTIGENYTLSNPIYADAQAEGILDRPFVYENYQTHMGELGLEGVLTFNKLRERTGVIFSLFGGLNLNGHYTGTDQRDANGDYAAGYLSIDPNLPSSLVRSTLQANILDGSYETDAFGYENGAQFNWTPSLGVELGYQVTPKFSVGLGHKVNFMRTDDFDGSVWDNTGNVTGDNDLHHYTNLHLRWDITPKERELPFPLITITNPRENPHTTNNPNANIRAKIEHVNSAMDVTYTINGRNERFSFNRTRFSANSLLQPGRNEVIITAQNTVGSDQKKVIIFYQETIIDPPPPILRPVVDITRPSGNSFTTRDAETRVIARVQRVNNRRDIQVNINGYNTNDFQFDSRRQEVTLDMPLQDGRNVVRITGQNTGGSDSDEVTIFRETIEAPSVRITTPRNDPHYDENRNQRIEAEVFGVNSRNDIRFTINGRRQSSFNFSGTRFSADITLEEGQHTIRIEAENEGGRADDDIEIVIATQVDMPQVRITTPSQDPLYTSDNRERIEADIFNIDRKSDIRMFINGRSTSNFNFSRTRLTADVTLNLGRNTIRIEARNDAGEADDQTVIYLEEEEPTMPPPTVKIVSTTQPTINPLDPENCKSTIIAEVEHVTRKSDITVRQNGRNVSNFTFSSSANTVTYTAQLEQGNNIIRIEVQNESGRDNDETTIEGCFVQEMPRPEVNITRPSRDNTTTSKASAEIEATVKEVASKRDIQFYHNGKSTTRFNFNTYTGKFDADVTLTEGTNTFRIVAENQSGSDEETVRIKYEKKIIIAPVQKPTVNITSPKSGAKLTQDRVTLEATVKHVNRKQDIQVAINGRTTSNFTFSGGKVKATINLKEGTTTLMVKASNKDGSDSDQVRVTYTKPVTIAKPSVKITRPTKSTVTTENNRQNVKANVLGVKGKNDIEVTINGRKVTNFVFMRNQLSVDATLKKGKNTVVIKASNKAGSAQDQVTFMLEVKEPKPEVSISSPRSGSTVKGAKVTFNGQVKNVANKSGVTLKLNGKVVSKFQFSRGKVSAELNLNTGKNTIELTGTNGSGSDQATVSVTYAKPVAKPTIKWTTPSRPGTTVNKAETTIKSTIRNVRSKKKITLTVNGKKTDFNFNMKGGLSANIKLTKGKNTIVVTAQNSAGEAKAETTITYKSSPPKGIKPDVKIVSTSTPTVDPFDPNKAKTSIIAELRHVSSKSDIKLTVNGRQISSFSFDTKTKKLVATITISKGKSTIKVEGKNSFGSDSASKTVTF